MNALATVAKLIQSNQDFEWYPTTDAMINIVVSHATGAYHSNSSILDIGAGDGRVLKAFPDLKKYAIEKSQILLNTHPSEITPIGTDFHTLSLMDKKADVIFCNPPYSEYVNWTARIISEANCNELYLVIPDRWRDNKTIRMALESRLIEDSKIQSIYTGDFQNADRKARANIEILRINFDRARTPFSAWLNTQFPEQDKTEEAEDLSDAVKHNLVSGQNILDVLVDLYGQEQAKLQENYTAIMNIDSSLLKQIQIDRTKIADFIQKSITDMKNKYWKELFDKYEPVTSKLTSKTRAKLLSSLTGNTAVEFTHDNVYMITGWVLKQVSSYYDDQIIETFYSLARDETIKEFKSNQKFFSREEMGYNRYSPKTQSRYYLLNRIIVDNGSNFSEYGSYYGGLSHGTNHNTFDDINDFIIVGRLLGFDGELMEGNKVIFDAGKAVDFYANYRGEKVLMMSMKLFLKGTMHIKFHHDYITKINILHGKLKGWVKSAQEASHEMDVDSEFVDSVYDKPLLDISAKTLLLN